MIEHQHQLMLSFLWAFKKFVWSWQENISQNKELFIRQVGQEYQWLLFETIWVVLQIPVNVELGNKATAWLTESKLTDFCLSTYLSIYTEPKKRAGE